MLRIVADNVGVTLPNRAEFIDRVYGYPHPFPVEIAVPCGWTFVIEDVLDIPHTSERCPCRMHWAIVYTHEVPNGLTAPRLAQAAAPGQTGEAGRESRPEARQPHGVVPYLRALWWW